MIARARYYAASLITLLRGVRNRGALVTLALGRGPIVVELGDGARFRVRTLMDLWIVKETCLDREYEARCVPIRDGWTVVDIGAGLGDFAISVAFAHPTCHVYAYEPFPESFAMLKENAALNGVRNVRTCPVAVGGRSEPMTLFTTGAAVQHTTTDGEPGAAGALTVPGQSLADLFESNGIEVCDFLKIDCEGGEFEILMNADADALRRIRHICLEYHDGFTRFSHADLAAFLRDKGFEVTLFPSPVHGHLGLLSARLLRK